MRERRTVIPDVGIVEFLIGAVVFSLVLAAVVSFVVRQAARSRNAAPPGGSREVEEIKERYEKGEIDREEYERKRRKLES